jgi:type III secretory pathway component EscR
MPSQNKLNWSDLSKLICTMFIKVGIVLMTAANAFGVEKSP